MGLLTEMLRGYATGVQAHTGLHYVPSFNDLNSYANDDMEEEVIKSERTSLSGAPMHGQANDGSILIPSPPASPGMYTMPAYQPTGASAPGGARMPRSNKSESGPGLDPFPDIHKVGRHMSARQHRMMDNARGPNQPSVWEMIAHHQDKKHT